MKEEENNTLLIFQSITHRDKYKSLTKKKREMSFKTTNNKQILHKKYKKYIYLYVD